MKYKNMQNTKSHKNRSHSSVRGLWERIPADRIYLVLLLMFGVVCLTVTGGWKVYTEPLKNAAGLLGMTEIVRDGQGETPGQTSPTEPLEEGLAGAWRPDEEELQTVPEDVESEGEDAENDAWEDDEPEDNMPGHREDFEEQTEFYYQTVEDDYFADAVFIGDSRTVGMYEYGGLQGISTFYASTGLSVHKLFTAKFAEVPGRRQKITVEEALSERQFAKVYFMLGINELGTGTAESFLQKYAESVAHIRELQPDAIIYLQGIMRVTEERSGKGDYITNEAINIRNEGIAALADNETIFYLEVNEAVCDESGAMISDYTSDGVHLKAQYIPLWKDYLKCHAIAFY